MLAVAQGHLALQSGLHSHILEVVEQVLGLVFEAQHGHLGAKLDIGAEVEDLDLVAALDVDAAVAAGLAAGVGLVRFPDLLARTHTAAKPQVLGLILLLFGLGGFAAAFIMLGGLYLVKLRIRKARLELMAAEERLREEA